MELTPSKQYELRHCVLIAARKSIETLSGLFDIMCRMDGKLRLPRLIMRIQSSIAITVAIRSNQPMVKNKNNFYLTNYFVLAFSTTILTVHHHPPSPFALPPASPHNTSHRPMSRPLAHTPEHPRISSDT